VIHLACFAVAFDMPLTLAILPTAVAEDQPTAEIGEVSESLDRLVPQRADPHIIMCYNPDLISHCGLFDEVATVR
jgi:hypothetical protein